MYNCIQNSNCFINFETSKECLLKNKDKKISCCVKECKGDKDLCLEECEFMFEYFTNKKYDIEDIMQSIKFNHSEDNKNNLNYNLIYFLIVVFIVIIVLSIIFNLKNEK